MQISFNPHDTDDLAMIARLLGTTTTAQAPADTPVAITPAAAIVQTPAAAIVQTPAAADSDPMPETDSNGMAWNDEIHSTPPALNADGSWRARRGKKDEYDAAIAAHKAAQTKDAGAAMAETMPTTTEPTGMPSAPAPAAMPAAPAPNTPPAPIAYEAMAKRFVAMMTAGTITDYENVYKELSVSYDDLETNQTSIARLWHYCDAIDDGQDHAGAVRHALGAE